jgi:hypothetical protein
MNISKIFFISQLRNFKLNIACNLLMTRRIKWQTSIMKIDSPFPGWRGNPAIMNRQIPSMTMISDNLIPGPTIKWKADDL